MPVMIYRPEGTAARSCMRAAWQERWLWWRSRAVCRVRVEEALNRDFGRNHDERTVPAVFAEASGPGHPELVERSLQVLVEPLVQVQADVVITVPPSEADDEHGTQMAVHRKRGRSGQS